MSTTLLPPTLEHYTLAIPYTPAQILNPASRPPLLVCTRNFLQIASFYFGAFVLIITPENWCLIVV